MTYKVHLDGYNLLPFLTDQAAPDAPGPAASSSTGTTTANS